MEPPKILIVSDDSEFSNAVVRSWTDSPHLPTSFTLGTSSEFVREGLDLTIVGGLRESQESPVLKSLCRTGKSVIYISRPNGSAPKLTGMVAIPEVEGWPQLLATVAGEILERMRAVAELSRLTEMSFQLERQAALGRYMVEARHNLNNALTSILGNCDLILLDDEQLPSATKRQVETIRNMGMRLNEIMQRFSSLQKEMLLVEQQSESSIKARAIAAGV